MAWWQAAFKTLLNSGKVVSMAGGALATGTYVFYKDKTRFHKMSRAYLNGSILPPYSENDNETVYFPRPGLETKLQEVLSSKSTNEYYLVRGESGTGKTRTVVEVVRRLIATDGRQNQGAPVFVLSSQGRSFPEALARSVHFKFDEHISFQFFLDFVMRIHTFPQRDDRNRLIRVLDAVEKSAFKYMTKHDRPMVLVIDGANSLEQYMPGALELMQEKAKLWADANIAKVVFIANDEETELFLQRRSSNWLRAANPIPVEDLKREEAIQFLRMPQFMEKSGPCGVMPQEDAEKIVDKVGGRVHHLIVCKRGWVAGKKLNEVLGDLESREREKFVSVSCDPDQWAVVAGLRDAPSKVMLLSKLIKETSKAAVDALKKENILRYGRDELGTTVQFQSQLTEVVVDEFQRVYVEDNKNLAKSRS